MILIALTCGLLATAFLLATRYLTYTQINMPDKFCFLFGAEFEPSRSYIIFLSIWMSVIYIIPWVFDIYMAIKIIHSLKESARKRQQLTNRQQNSPEMATAKNRTAILVMAHLLCHMVASFPIIAYFSQYYLDETFGKEAMALYYVSYFVPIIKMVLSMPINLLLSTAKCNCFGKK